MIIHPSEIITAVNYYYARFYLFELKLYQINFFAKKHYLY